MAYKLRRLRLGAGTPPQAYDIYPGEPEWVEIDAADDEALLKVNSGNDYHLDVKDGNAWRCISSNVSSCFVLEARLREKARLAKLSEERRQAQAREAALAEAQRLREEAKASERAAKDAEKRAKELETANA